jgi:aminopeptidase N
MQRRLIYFGSILLLLSSSIVKAQVTFANIDVQHYTFAITLNDANDNIKGKAEVTIKFLGDVNQIELNLVKKKATGKGMLVSSVTENGKSVQFVQDSDVLNIQASPRMG